MFSLIPTVLLYYSKSGIHSQFFFSLFKLISFLFVLNSQLGFWRETEHPRNKEERGKKKLTSHNLTQIGSTIFTLIVNFSFQDKPKICQLSVSQNVVLRPAASASSGNLLERQILEPSPNLLC